MTLLNILTGRIKENLSDYCEHGEVKGWERILSVVSGAALALLSIKKIKKSPISAISQLTLAGALLWRGISGKCKVKEMIDEQLS